MDNKTAHKLYNYLSPVDKEIKADLIIGFGHFDMRIPERCIQLFNRGLAPKILFTGGVGAGSADFKNPEAIEFLNFIKSKFPSIDCSNVLIESTSTNTGENLRYSIQILNNKGMLESIKKIILVATPSRQLRVYLTAKKYFPNAQLINLPPFSSFDKDKQMNEYKKVNFTEHLIGELERIKLYSNKEYIHNAEIPIELTTDKH